MADPRRSFLGIVGGAWLALGVAAAPPAPPWFRPWERAIDEAAPERFVPGARITLPTCGDLAHNLRRGDLARWRTTTLTTDAAGLRNPPLATTPRVVVVGDSYVGGANLDDAETITAALGRRLGEPVHNHAPPANELPSFLADERRRGFRVVVLMLVVRHLVAPPAEEPWRLPAPDALRRADAAIGLALERTRRDRRLAAAARWAVGDLRGRLGVTHPYLSARWRGQEVLLLSPRDQAHRRTDAAEQAENLRASLVALREALRPATLVFAPIPDTADLHPELFDPRTLPPGEPLLPRFVEAGRAAGVPTVELLPALRATGDYLWAPDDSHWSPRGVEVAAEAVAAAVRPHLPAR